MERGDSSPLWYCAGNRKRRQINRGRSIRSVRRNPGDRVLRAKAAASRRSPGPGGTMTRFELCVCYERGGTGLRRLTNSAGTLTHTGRPMLGIVFHRPVGARARFHLSLINADGTGERSLSNPPGLNGCATCGGIRSGGQPVRRCALPGAAVLIECGEVILRVSGEGRLEPSLTAELTGCE